MRSPRARWSMPRGPGSPRCSTTSSMPTLVPRSAWSRAVTSSCRSSMSTTAAMCCATPTDGTSSSFPTSDDFTLIGTTEEDYHGDPGEAAADSAEIAYLIAAVGEYFRRPIFEDDIVWAWSGVRALPDGGGSRRVVAAAARAMSIEVDSTGRQPPLVTILGGRLATYRRLAEEVLDRLAPFLKVGPQWTAGRRVAGRPVSRSTASSIWSAALRAGYPFLAERHAARLATAYGTRAHTIVSGARSMADLGRLLRRRPHRGRGPLPDRRRNGPRPPRTSSGGAPSSASGLHGRLRSRPRRPGSTMPARRQPPSGPLRSARAGAA